MRWRNTDRAGRRAASEDRDRGTPHGVLSFLLRLAGADQGKPGMQKATKRVRVRLWREVLEYGDVEVTVPVSASLEEINQAAIAGYENTDIEAGGDTDGETIRWLKATWRPAGIPMVRPSGGVRT